MIVTTLLGYFLLLSLFYMERRLRGRAEAARPAEGQFDRRGTRLLGYAYFTSIVVLLASWILNALGIGTLPHWVGWLGVALALGGLLMRAWANHVLGGLYTRTLRVVEGQRIIRDGPYRLIRHPAYLGMILMWIGVSVATANWIVMVIVVVAILAAYRYRIENEEQVLLSTLPGYAEYRAGTWRLIPPIY